MYEIHSFLFAVPWLWMGCCSWGGLGADNDAIKDAVKGLPLTHESSKMPSLTDPSRSCIIAVWSRPLLQKRIGYAGTHPATAFTPLLATRTTAGRGLLSRSTDRPVSFASQRRRAS
jgi:hypothetical protein